MKKLNKDELELLIADIIDRISTYASSIEFTSDEDRNDLCIGIIASVMSSYDIDLTKEN